PTPHAAEDAGDSIYNIGNAEAEFSVSKPQRMLHETNEGKEPPLDLETEKERKEKLLEAIKKGVIASAEDISEGGLAVALAKKAMGANRVSIEVTVKGDLATELFSETQSRYIVSVKPEHVDTFEKICMDAVKIGTVTADETFIVRSDAGEEIIKENVKE